MLNNSVLITFEGIDGSGKSTVIDKLYKYFNKFMNIDCVKTRDPGELPISEQIRKLIMNNDNDPITDLLLFEAARREMYKNIIKPIIESENKVDIILCDRYIDSTYVYQNAIGIDKEFIKSINDKVIDNNYPDLTIILDINPVIALERINKNREDNNRYDEKDVEFYENIRTKYTELKDEFEDREFIVVDANKNSDELFDEILECINDFLVENRLL